METKVYSKNDILQKLAQDGFFVDYLTLNSFIEKYKIEAIFEDDDGNEFFDKSAYEILVSNVLKRQPVTPPVQEPVSDLPHQQSYFDKGSDNLSQIPAQANVSSVDNTPLGESIKNNTENDDKKKSLENIKWYRWDDVSADLTSDENKEDLEIIDSDSDKHTSDVVSQVNETLKFDNNINGTSSQTQENYWGTTESNAKQTEIHLETTQDVKLGEINNELNKVMSSADDNEDDFDDIGLLSDSIQAQEKFQSYIVNELAKKNIDVTPPKSENAFKFDISEKTLNMIARAIAKKIAKQVSTVLSNEDRNSTKLIQAEKKSQILEQKLAAMEEQNKKLKLLLVESNKNLNSYKPTFFGFYRFVRKKPKKR